MKNPFNKNTKSFNIFEAYVAKIESGEAHGHKLLSSLGASASNYNKIKDAIESLFEISFGISKSRENKEDQKDWNSIIWQASSQELEENMEDWIARGGINASKACWKRAKTQDWWKAQPDLYAKLKEISFPKKEVAPTPVVEANPAPVTPVVPQEVAPAPEKPSFFTEEYYEIFSSKVFKNLLTKLEQIKLELRGFKQGCAIITPQENCYGGWVMGWEDPATRLEEIEKMCENTGFKVDSLASGTFFIVPR